MKKLGYVKWIGLVSKERPKITMLTYKTREGFISITLKRVCGKKRVILEVFKDTYDTKLEMKISKKVFEQEFKPNQAKKVEVNGLIQRGMEVLGYKDYRYFCSEEDKKKVNRFLHEFSKFVEPKQSSK